MLKLLIKVFYLLLFIEIVHFTPTGSKHYLGKNLIHILKVIKNIYSVEVEDGMPHPGPDPRPETVEEEEEGEEEEEEEEGTEDGEAEEENENEEEEEDDEEDETEDTEDEMSADDKELEELLDGH